MAEERNNQQMIVIGLVAVVVLLVGVVGFMMYQSSQSLPEPTAQAPATAPADTGAGAMPPAGDAAAAVDPGKATKVPAGTTPEQFVTEYYKACDTGDFESAVKHLPADKQASTSPEALKEQLAGYGIAGFTVAGAQEQGDTATVVVDQKTAQFGTFENTWTFQKDGDSWVLVGKAVTGMKQ